jgi:hypothetical protein
MHAETRAALSAGAQLTPTREDHGELDADEPARSTRFFHSAAATNSGAVSVADGAAVGSVAPGTPGQFQANGFAAVAPPNPVSVSLNLTAFKGFTTLWQGVTPAGMRTPGMSPRDIPTFTFVDRPDARDDENYGLMPSTYGYASGLLVTFDVSQGQLDNPQVIAAPPGCGNVSVTQVEDNTVLVDLGQPCALPAGIGIPGGVDNEVTLQVTTDPSAQVAPVAITWLAPVNNVVPRHLSGEHNFDSEPSLAVNPAGGTLALTTFSGEWSSTQGAPLWISGDGGLTWDQRFGIPEPEPGAFGPADQTLAYNSDGSALYGAFLGGSRFLSTYVQATPDPLTTDFSSTFSYIGATDQPWIQVGPVDPDTGLDRVYVSVNDSGYPQSTPRIVVSTDGGVTFQPPARLDQQPTSFDDYPPRVAVSGDRVYGAFARHTGPVSGAQQPGEIVVVRDDQGGTLSPSNPSPFSDLGAGVIVQSGSYPTAAFLLGQQRIGGDISLAIDPNNPDTVYLSYSRIENNQPVLYVHRSDDGGNTWEDVLAVDNAAIGNLAVAANGTWGLLNVRVDSGQMIEEFRQNGGDPMVLASWPVNDPRGGVVYVGDYQSLVTVGNTFYAGFCASNNPDVTDFPAGVVFQRNADFVSHTLRTEQGAVVQRSIDPYVFHQDALAGAAGLAGRELLTPRKVPNGKG